MTLLAPETITHLDFEPEETVPCIYTTGGEHPAIWVGTMVPCGHAYAFCTEHRAVAEEYLEDGVAFCSHQHPKPIVVRDWLWARIQRVGP